MEDSHQTEDELEDILDDTPDSTPTGGHDSEEVSEEAFLKRWNEMTGRNDKSIEAVRKQEAEARKLAAKLGKQEVPAKKAEAPSVHPVMRSLYFEKHPEVADYWETVEKEADALGKDPFELYESSSFLQGEAKSRYETKKADEEAKTKISKPSEGAGDGSRDLNSVSDGEVSSLTPAEKLKWLKLKAGK